MVKKPIKRQRSKQRLTLCLKVLDPVHFFVSFSRTMHELHNRNASIGVLP